MDIKQAAAGPVVVQEGGALDGEWPLLPMRETLPLLREYFPGKDAACVTIFELYSWAQNEQGSSYVLLLSQRQRDPSATRDAIERMGALIDRIKLARLILSESMVSGEEVAEDDDGALGEADDAKKPSPATG